MAADTKPWKDVSFASKTFLVLFVCLWGYGISYAGAVGSPPVRYDPVMLSEGVASQPGAVSWSSDGRQIAFIRHGVAIYDIGSKKYKYFNLRGVSYLEWLAQERLLIVYEEDGRNLLCLADTETLATKKIALGLKADGFSPIAAYGLGDGNRFVVLMFRMKALTIGTDLRYRLLLHDTTRDRTREIYAFGRVFPALNPDVPSLNAWGYAGLDPMKDRLLIFEHLKPPVGKLYTRVSTIDWATGRSIELTDCGRMNSLGAASWSPDGKRLAVADGNGRLEIVEQNGLALPVDEPVQGRFPSWNPAGSQIFMGGYVTDSDGKNRIPLFPDDKKSFAAWSPGGGKMAVVSGGRLWLLSKFTPYFVSPDRPADRETTRKILTLRDLFLDGLLKEEEYLTRYDGIRGGARQP